MRLTAPRAEASESSTLVTAEAGGSRWALRSDRREFLLVSTVVVGRGVGVDIQVDDESVSRRHACFRLVEDAPVVEDLDSRNGTWVNGHAISAPAHLALGDRVVLGDCEFELVTAPDSQQDRVTQPRGATLAAGASAPSPLSALSPRERAVFPLLARGLSQREIAAQCGVSVKTVETYRTRISHKLGLHSRADLIRFALENGVLRSRARN